jgi:hypothetical protein
MQIISRCNNSYFIHAISKRILGRKPHPSVGRSFSGRGGMGEKSDLSEHFATEEADYEVNEQTQIVILLLKLARTL